MTMPLPNNVVSFQSAITIQDAVSLYGFSDASVSFSASKFVESDRFKEMDRWQSYAECTQHDNKRYDFDGRVVKLGPGLSQQLLSEKATYYVPMRMRRPSTPYRIIKRVVSAFSNLLFGEGRFPDFIIQGDREGQEFVEALVEVSALPVKALLARNIGGAVGTVGISWCYHNGDPIVDVHNGKNLHVHEWIDKSQLVPKHVTEVFRYKKDVWDQQKKAMVRELWWYRRDWTENADVVFQEKKSEGSVEPRWVVDEEKTVVHNDGFCHFIWIQNIPDGERVDGKPDSDGVLEQSDSLDIMWSVMTRGGIANLDPTLKLRMDPELVGHSNISKGSEHAICTGVDGDASYLELGGSSITAGLALTSALRAQILETCECVIPDPDKVVAAGTSSVALKMVFATMLGKTEILRETYGKALRTLIRQMLVVAQKHATPSMQEQVDEDGNPYTVEVVGIVNLPPKVESEPVLDEEGNPTGEESITITQRSPGKSTTIEASWGPYFQPTSDDQQKVVGTLVSATAGKQVCSQKTAVEILATVFSRDPAKLWSEVEGDSDRENQKAMAMMDSMGASGSEVQPPEYEDEVSEAEAATRVAGEQPPDGADSQLPTGMGASPVPTPSAQPTTPAQPVVPAAIKIALTSTDIASIVTVNEARAGTGLGPMKLADGTEDPDGYLTVTEFKVKRQSLIAAVSNAEKGQVGVKDANSPPPKPPQFGG